MTEEVEVVETSVEDATPEVVDTPEYSEIEQQAREQGWRPKEEWEGDETKWRDAKEFVERGELYSKIDTMGRDLKDTKKALKMLQEHHSKLKEVEYNKAVQELKAAQKKNLETGDADAYLETTELLTDLKAEQKAVFYLIHLDDYDYVDKTKQNKTKKIINTLCTKTSI